MYVALSKLMPLCFCVLQLQQKLHIGSIESAVETSRRDEEVISDASRCHCIILYYLPHASKALQLLTFQSL
jgi:hypothetical protein